MNPFWCELPLDLLTITGPDALSYLQGQISQDIRTLSDGDSTYTFVLQPIGRVDALARVRRVSAEEFVLDTDAGFGDALAARLNRFKIRVKVDILLSTVTAVAVRYAAAPLESGVPAWGRDDAFDLFDAPPPADLRRGSADELLGARIDAGWPAMGAEITDATIPAETGVIGVAVSFTKGCYPGQELVERMDSRGSTAPRFVRRVRGPGSVALGDEVVRSGAAVGHLTSVIVTGGAWSALAVVARAAQPGDEVSVGGATSVIEDVSSRET